MSHVSHKFDKLENVTNGLIMQLIFPSLVENSRHQTRLVPLGIMNRLTRYLL